MIDRDKIWTGELNRRALEPQPAGPIGLYDTTLRDGEQTVGVVLGPEDKLEIARALDDAGVDRIEAGFPRVSAEDAEAIRLIADAGLRAEVWGFSRAVPADVEALVELGVKAAVIESPISDLKLEALGVPREKMLERIAGAVSFAVANGITVAFFGVDSTRADLDFYRQAYSTAVEAGASEVVAVDTIGVATPEAAAYLVGRTAEWLDVPVHWHGHNDFGLATAAAAAAVQAGATWIHGTVNGMGERAGNANLLEVALALEALYGISTRLDLTKARALAALVQERSGYSLEPWKPLTGDNLFTRESGAVASQFHDPPSIEPYASELVGADRSIVLGKKSGLDSIRLKAEELGLDVPEERQAGLLAAVKELGTTKRRLVSDAEFRDLSRSPLTDMSGTRDTRSQASDRAVKGARTMKFSLYSEIQSWPEKSAAELYGEILEQIVNADRLGYDAYAVIEHFFFPKFSISASPLALFAAAAQRTRNITFRTLLHSMPYHNPPVLASQIAVADILLGGRYEFGVGRGHGWMPPKAGLALTPESRERYEESVELLFTALENERFSFDGKHFQIADSRDRPSAGPAVPRLRRRHLRSHVRACRRARLGGGGAAAPAVRGAEGPARPLPCEVRGARQRARHRVDPRVLHRRGSRGRAARGQGLDDRLPARQRVAADRVRAAADGRAARIRLRLLCRRHPREARRHPV